MQIYAGQVTAMPGKLINTGILVSRYACPAGYFTNVELEKIARDGKEVKSMNSIKKMWESIKNILFRRKNR